MDETSLTPEAREAINSADIILADNTIHKSILGIIPKNVRLYFSTGDSGKKHREEIDMYLSYLEEGKHIVRLKNGDPCVFGGIRGEIKMAKALGYKPDIIPGVTSVVAASACVGITLTAENIADKFMVISGHSELPAFDTKCTIVLVSCEDNCRKILGQMLKKGYPEKLPIAHIYKARSISQRYFKTCIGAFLLNRVQVEPPSTMIVGWVVSR